MTYNWTTLWVKADNPESIQSAMERAYSAVEPEESTYEKPIHPEAVKKETEGWIRYDGDRYEDASMVARDLIEAEDIHFVAISRFNDTSDTGRIKVYTEPERTQIWSDGEKGRKGVDLLAEVYDELGILPRRGRY